MTKLSNAGLSALLLCGLASCKPNATQQNEVGTNQPAGQSVAAKQAVTIIPPGFERAAAGPSYLLRLTDDRFGVVDPIAHDVLVIDATGATQGSRPLPTGFEVRDVDIGKTIVLRGDDREVELGSDLSRALTEKPLAQPGAAVTRNGAALVIHQTNGGPKDLTVAPIDADQVLTATFLGLDDQANAYVYWEQGTGRHVESWAGRFGLDGKMNGSMRIDLSQFSTVPALPVALIHDGDLLLMRPKAKSVELAKLSWPEGGRAASEESVGSVPAEALEFGDSEVSVDDARYAPERAEGPPPAYDPAFGQAAVARARSYLEATWTLAQANFAQPGIPHNCSPPQGKYWLRPRTLTADRVGKAITGLPYKWGGFDSVDQFRHRVAGNPAALAGSVCTCREDRYHQCIVDRAAGVDCSGFVSRAWGLSGHTGTSALLGKAGELPSLLKLQPGDALDRPGSHVRLFVRFEPGPQVKLRTIESAVSCGGLCEKVYTPAELASYRPIRLKH